MKVLLLNGPPRSGKDTISAILKNRSSSFVHEEKFAMPMKRCVPLIYSVPLEHWKTRLDTAANKDLPCSEFFGVSPRQAQINFSEEYLKPIHGQNIFGDLLVRRLDMICGGFAECAVISDSGFVPEAERVVEEFGAENVQLWRIHRDDCDYVGDSRNYIDLQYLGVDSYVIDNSGSMDDLRDIVEPLFDAMMLPRDNSEHVAGEPVVESDEEWLKRKRFAAQQAFDLWPERRIQRIEASKSSDA